MEKLQSNFNLKEEYAKSQCLKREEIEDMGYKVLDTAFRCRFIRGYAVTLFWDFTSLQQFVILFFNGFKLFITVIREYDFNAVT